MKKYITPNIELADFQMNGTLCSSEQPSATPPSSDTRPSAGAPGRRPF